MKPIRLVLPLLAVSLCSQAHAAGGLFSLNVEPIVGYERVQKVLPTPHAKSRLIYGARLTAGVPLIAAEAEVTRGSDTEQYLDQDLTYKDTDDKLKLGLRSSLRLSSLLSLTARAGGQAKRTRQERITSAGTEIIESGPTYRPYAGAGLNMHLMSGIYGSAGVTVVFNDFPRMAANDYEATAGFSVRFP